MEYTFKIIVIGDAFVGKTSIIKRYVHSQNIGPYKPTIGIDFAQKVLLLNNGSIVRLQLWDICGQERFGTLTRHYYKDAVGAIVVFDIGRHSSFANVSNWWQDAKEKVNLNGSVIPGIVLANKCDTMRLEAIKKREDMDRYCKENEFLGWYETSAKDNINIDKAFKFLVDRIMEKISALSPKPQDPSVVYLEKEQSNNNTFVDKKGGCCG